MVDHLNELKHYFKMDTWTVVDGLELIAGIYPDPKIREGAFVKSYSDIPLKDYFSNDLIAGQLFKEEPEFMVHIRRVEIREYVDQIAYNGMPTDRLLDIEDECKGWLINESFAEGLTSEALDVRPEEAESRKRLDEAKETLLRMVEVWEAGQHEKNRYPPSHFIQWAKKKGFEIPWLLWAEENKLLSEEESEMHNKERKTYLNIIGALLHTILEGHAKDGFKSQASLIEHIEEFHSLKQSLKKRTLEDTFAAANKEFK